MVHFSSENSVRDSWLWPQVGPHLPTDYLFFFLYFCIFLYFIVLLVFFLVPDIIMTSQTTALRTTCKPLRISKEFRWIHTHTKIFICFVWITKKMRVSKILDQLLDKLFRTSVLTAHAANPLLAYKLGEHAIKSHRDSNHYNSTFLFPHAKRIWILKAQGTLASFVICHGELSTPGVSLPKWVHASSWVGRRPAKRKVPGLIPGLQATNGRISLTSMFLSLSSSLPSPLSKNK